MSPVITGRMKISGVCTEYFITLLFPSIVTDGMSDLIVTFLAIRILIFTVL